MDKKKEKKNISKVREKIGMVFQSYDLFPNMTILNNLLLAPMKVQKRKKEEAEKELKKYKTDVCASGSLFTVEEFSIQENEYDEDGEWIGGGDIWKFTPMEIFVVDKETRKTIAKIETYEEAEEAAEEYEGDAGADIVFYE